jgi:DNA-binding CsgD family transcriptional regulator
VQAIQISELEAIRVGIEILSQSSNAQDLCRRIAHAEFMDGFCHGVAVFLLDQRSMLVEVASYGQNFDLGQDEISTRDANVLSKAVRSRNIAVESLDTATLFALPIELSGVTTGAFLFTLAENAPSPAFSKQVTSMLSRLGGLFMGTKGLSLKEPALNQKFEGSLTTSSAQEMTTRQLKILQLMADGLTNAAIAKIVLLSESTVRQETIRIFRIMQCHSRTEAIVKARAIGILDSVS